MGGASNSTGGVNDYTNSGCVFQIGPGTNVNDWADRTGNLPAFHTGCTSWAVRAVCLDQTRPSLLLAGTDAGVFRTTNNGASWEATGLGVSIADLLCSPAEGALYAATTSNGVHRSVDGGVTWTAMNRGLGDKTCVELALDSEGKRLFVGTAGNSLCRTRIGPRIEVVSSQGAENSPGTAQTNWFGVALTNSVQSPQVQGGTQYVCTGWTLTGQTDTGGASAGSGLMMTMTHTNDAILAWQWQTNYWCVFSSNGLGGVSRTNSWLPRGGAVSVTAVPAYTNRFHHWSGTGTNFIVAGNASTPTVQVAAGAPFDLIANFISAYEAWKQAHFTAEQLADPEVSGDDADPDHDRMSNEQEYLAGTEPKSGGSCLVCSASTLGEGGFVLQWQSATGKVYSVCVSTNLLCDLFTNRLAVGILATPPTNAYLDATARTCAFYRVTCEKPDPYFPDIDATQALGLIAASGGDPDFVVLDVRTSAEYAERHIVGAINLDYYAPDFAAQLDALDKNRAYLIHCRTGGRSGLTHALMEGLGFHKVYDMLGGIEAFEALPGAGAYLVP
jgi:rhodanese-related sulfurtransferase